MANTKNPIQSNFATLVESLRWRAANEGDRKAVTFLNDGETESGSHTYAELDEEARKIAGELQKLARPGDRALLAYPPGLEFIAAYYGCLYAKVIGVPVYPPRNNRSLGRLQAIVQDAGAKLALTTAAILTQLETTAASSPEFNQMKWVGTDRLPANGAASWRELPIAGTDVAFLQYTSGSTGNPKGVVVAHENLVANIKMMTVAFDNTRDTVCVSWLPVHHDMGLIGCVLMPLFEGFPTVLMPPMAFLEKPIRWLAAISKYGATFVTAPNFSYELCVRKVEPNLAATLNLSSLYVVCNGAEPIRSETLERFTERYKPSGFKRMAFFPCYGLAEATLYASGSHLSGQSGISVDKSQFEEGAIHPIAHTSPLSRTIVSCGHSAKGQGIAIANPETQKQCSQNEVGEVWLSGPHIAKGYWNNSDATKRDFQAQLLNQTDTTFLRTGDLGFMSGDSLFVTGRLKDLIIVNGKNHYPQDIELTVEKSQSAVRAGNCVAFATDGKMSEELVVVAEIERSSLGADLKLVANTAATSVWENHELRVSQMVFVKPGSLPKTSSGKLQRRLTNKLLAKGQIEALFRWESGDTAGSTPSEISPREANHLAPIIEQLLTWFSKSAEIPRETIDPGRPLTEYKLDSLIAFELGAKIEEYFRFKVPPGLITRYPTLKAVAEFIHSNLQGNLKRN